MLCCLLYNHEKDRSEVVPEIFFYIEVVRVLDHGFVLVVVLLVVVEVVQA